jgi:uncharacterized glyoxalase superfamily protein PhnB
MSALLSQANILITTDFARALAYWNDQLGFATMSIWDEPPSFAILKRDACRVMIGAAKVLHEITPHWKLRPGLWNAYFWVSDATALFAEMTRRGAIIDYGLEDKPYGVREFGVRDPDGHDIGFGQVLDDMPATKPAT